MFAVGDKDWPGLGKLNEEAGELIQVIGKLMQTHGDPQHWESEDPQHLRRRLEEEIGDLQAAIGFVVSHCDLDTQAIRDRFAVKRARFERWRAEQGEGAG